ncbi:hypothetical protein B0I27_10433 [Arcticibacter pallidicorallinus]|uniref:Uncharacterized protein n=1 Tax=Arcticibacter pallidicorallinus TaxID=1259464 RepID=A0A2T0U527_9SPHI|nr:hypothetical protein B0I27_10433 [Arcticibacter pallidicorallinus]
MNSAYWFKLQNRDRVFFTESYLERLPVTRLATAVAYRNAALCGP